MADSRSIDQVQQEIIGEMAELEDSMDKYKYLVEQAAELDCSPESLKTEANLISGCQASVWLCVKVKNEQVELNAYSDARIVRGILALLHRVFDRQSPADVLATDLYFLEETGLKEHLSPHRANGLQSIVEQIKAGCRNC